ncbi:MAG: hypothetical protein DRP66_06975, partial [Planctomycetota bacterium]
VVWLDRQHGAVLRKEISRRAKWGADGWKYHGKTFTVVNIVDGDTLDLAIGDGKFDNTRVRLLGMDSPETKSPKVGAMFYGAEATAFAEQLADGKEVTVILDTVGDVRDIYDRLLAYIRLDDGRVVNEELIVNGFAYADLRFRHSQYDRYLRLQQKAMEQKAGLWKDVTRNQLPKWLQRERPDLLKQD